MKIADAAFSLTLLLTASCDMFQQSPGLLVTDGCYYAETTPVLRVNGSHGTFVIPGTVENVRIISQKNPNGVTIAMFEPGFELRTRPRLETVSPANVHNHIFLMMKPGTTIPTIMAVSDPIGVVTLARGAAC